MARRSVEDIKLRRVGGLSTQIPIQAIDARDRKAKKEQEDEEEVTLSGEDETDPVGPSDNEVRAIHASVQTQQPSVDDEIERLAINVVKIRNALIRKGIPSNEVCDLVRALIELSRT